MMAGVTGLSPLLATLLEVKDDLVVVVVVILVIVPRVIGGRGAMGVRRVLGELVLKVLDALTQASVFLSEPSIFGLKCIEPLEEDLKVWCLLVHRPQKVRKDATSLAFQTSAAM